MNQHLHSGWCISQTCFEAHHPQKSKSSSSNWVIIKNREGTQNQTFQVNFLVSNNCGCFTACLIKIFSLNIDNVWVFFTSYKLVGLEVGKIKNKKTVRFRIFKRHVTSNRYTRIHQEKWNLPLGVHSDAGLMKFSTQPYLKKVKINIILYKRQQTNLMLK